MSISGEVSSWFRRVREIKKNKYPSSICHFYGLYIEYFIESPYGILRPSSWRIRNRKSEIPIKMLLIKSTTQAYLPCFFPLSTVVSQAVYNFPQRQWHKPSYSIPFQFPDCRSLYYEKDTPLWIQQTSCAASAYIAGNLARNSSNAVAFDWTYDSPHMSKNFVRDSDWTYGWMPF